MSKRQAGRCLWQSFVAQHVTAIWQLCRSFCAGLSREDKVQGGAWELSWRTYRGFFYRTVYDRTFGTDTGSYASREWLPPFSFAPVRAG